MAPPRHLDKWLEIVEPPPGRDSARFSVRVYDRLDRIVEELDPCHQKPSVIVMWGGRRKDEALSALLDRHMPSSRTEHRRPNFELLLHPNTNRPMIFVDCHEPASRTSHQGPDYDPQPRGLGVRLLRSVTISYPPTSRGGQLSTCDLVSSRLLLAIADVVCVFLCDFGDVHEAENRLASWVAQGPASTLPAPIRPRLLLVSNRDIHPDVVEDFLIRLSNLRRRTSQDIFSTVTVVDVSEHPSLNSVTRHRRLKEQVWNLSDQAQVARCGTGTWFSARHLVAFVHRLMGHLASGKTEPFDVLGCLYSV